MKCKTCGHEEPDKPKTIVIDGWAYDTETTQKGVLFKDIQYPEGAYLWTASDFAKFTTEQWKALKLEDEWFFIQQPINEMEKRGYIAWFDAYSGGANLVCIRDTQSSYSTLGVRFKYKVKK